VSELHAGAAPVRADDGFAAYAVTTRSGPHVTMQAGVVQSGRFITTTSRSSLKARCVRNHGTAAATIEHGDGSTEVLAGATVAVDLRHPEGMLTDPAGALIAGPAALRLAGDQLEQLLGYVESAGKVPAGWLPHNRVLLVSRVDRSMRIRGFDVEDGEGSWAASARPEAVLHPTERDPAPLPELPDEVAPLVDTEAPARVGLATPDGPVALPARWRGHDRFDVPAGALARLGADLPGPGCATFDDSADRRPDRKRGVMLRGDVALVGLAGSRATLAVTPQRFTAWDGFSASTSDVAPGS
jgi:hypothetical protein